MSISEKQGLVLGDITALEIASLVIDGATVRSNGVSIRATRGATIIDVNGPNLLRVIISVASVDSCLWHRHLLSEVLRVLVTHGVQELEPRCVAVVSIIVRIFVGCVEERKPLENSRCGFGAIYTYIQPAALLSGGRRPTGRPWIPDQP